MAIVKKARPAAKKAAKAKPASKKPVAVKVVSTSKKSTAKPAAKKAVPNKKKTAAPVKKTVNKPAAKKVIPQPSKAPVKKSPSPAKTAVSVKKVVVEKIAKKPEVPAKAIKPQEKKQDIKPVVPSKAPGKAAKDKTVAGKANTKPATGLKPDDKLDPLHVKAAKAMKELSETMDLNKVRPRIQAGTSPKPAPRAPQQPLKLIEPTNTNKIKFQLELEFRSSPKILFNYLSDSSGLAGWFADDVKTKDDVFTFVWEGSESYARLIAIKDLQLVRFQWLEETDGTYFQFEIKEDDITSDVALIITDFANPGERDTNMRLWESQVQKLRLLLGSF